MWVFCSNYVYISDGVFWLPLFWAIYSLLGYNYGCQGSVLTTLGGSNGSNQGLRTIWVQIASKGYYYFCVIKLGWLLMLSVKLLIGVWRIFWGDSSCLSLMPYLSNLSIKDCIYEASEPQYQQKVPISPFQHNPQPDLLIQVKTQWPY